MIPNDFVDLAARLSNGNNEAEFRTSVSRAYYGTFHAAVQILVEAGILLPVGPESHHKVRLCLLECGEPAGFRAGSRLQTLRKQRNIADYDLQDSINQDEKNAKSQVEIARLILRLLDTCRQEPARTRFRLKVRDYAANVLRLPVTEL
jgi:uncharacterized protein (UPF0332 family)